MKPINEYFDHTLLKPEATTGDILRLCREAKDYGFYAVCVNSRYVAPAREELTDCDVKIAAVVGFPLGACSTEVKAFEAHFACGQGAAEIDMVLSVGAVKEKNHSYIVTDIKAVVEAAKKHKAIVKVILETGLLSDQEIVMACKLAEEGGAAFVKTSTGFSAGGATKHHVALMKSTVGNRLQVKASGGIRTLETMEELIEAGADRIGASASVAMMQAYMERQK